MKTYFQHTFNYLMLGFFILSFLPQHVFAQIERVEPPHWWADMKYHEIELMFYGENIGSYKVEVSAGEITSVASADSPNYLFVTWNTKGISPKTVEFDFRKKRKTLFSYEFELKKRDDHSANRQGFTSEDAVYLITPDRFANANPDNDIVEEMREKHIDRSNDYARHGGDIQGIIQHLDYVEEMGFTAVWPSPLLENNMDEASYHGYAITDFYRVDPRFGTLEEYKELVEKANEKNLKIIIDMVANHCGSGHWWMQDLPFQDWLNYQDIYEAGNEAPNSSHKRTVNQDPYASDYDTDMMKKGWFVQTMPDLNQKNEFMARYLIQNSIWWVEELGLQGIRQDTYPYPDKHFMADWAGAIMQEYPNFNIVGEEWSYNPLIVGYWQDGQHNFDGYQSNLKSVMDFPMQGAIISGLKESEEGWGNGLTKIYEALANDFYYPNPLDVMVFADNHDKSRVFTQLDGNIHLNKMAMALLLSLPRTPQIYYGTEILMEDFENPGDHGLIRTDFPGGWEGDEVNVFTETGLTTEQLDFKHFLKDLLQFRKSSKALQIGQTKHFEPFNGMYFLFRMHKDEVVLTVINKNEETQKVDVQRFEELGFEGETFESVLTKDTMIWKDSIEIKSGVSVFKLN